jgi:hypothetical protein
MRVAFGMAEIMAAAIFSCASILPLIDAILRTGIPSRQIR